jgi:hypothetical protein
MVKSQTTRQQSTINKKDKTTTMLKLIRNEREQDSGRARSWEGNKGSNGSLRKEVLINVEFAKRTPQWIQTGQR